MRSPASAKTSSTVWRVKKRRWVRSRMPMSEYWKSPWSSARRTLPWATLGIDATTRPPGRRRRADAARSRPGSRRCSRTSAVSTTSNSSSPTSAARSLVSRSQITTRSQWADARAAAPGSSSTPTTVQPLATQELGGGADAAADVEHALAGPHEGHDDPGPVGVAEVDDLVALGRLAPGRRHHRPASSRSRS